MGPTDVHASAPEGAGNRTREDVVVAAGHLFAKRGFHGTSMRDLGEELGMLGSSLYSHVQGKNELLVEVIRRGADLFNDVVARATNLDEPAIEQLRQLVYGHVGVVIGNIDESRTFLFESRFLEDKDRLQIVEMRDAYEAAYRSVIQRGIKEGSIAGDVDAGISTIFILSVLNALTRWYRPSGSRSADEIAGEMWSFISNGILAGGTA